MKPRKLYDKISYYAAILMGRITGLVRQSVRPVRAPNSKTKRRRKTKIGVNVSLGKD